MKKKKKSFRKFNIMLGRRTLIFIIAYDVYFDIIQRKKLEFYIKSFNWVVKWIV